MGVCEVCGSATTLPHVSDEEAASFYPGVYSAYRTRRSRLARSGAWRRLRDRRPRHELPFRRLRGSAPGWMLDVGCGKGQIGGPFADAGWHVVGIDPSPEACAAAAARGIEARQGTLASASLATEERFDVVVFHHSLEHSTDPAADLRRAAEALRPGGQILISVPNFGGWQARLFRSSWFHLDLPRHRTHFTPMGLGLALERAGLAAEAVGTTTSSVGLFASLEIAIRKRSVFRGGPLARMALPVAFFTSLPARAVGRVRADGDTLHAVARARCATISR